MIIKIDPPHISKHSHNWARQTVNAIFKHCPLKDINDIIIDYEYVKECIEQYGCSNPISFIWFEYAQKRLNCACTNMSMLFDYKNGYNLNEEQFLNYYCLLSDEVYYFITLNFIDGTISLDSKERKIS